MREEVTAGELESYSGLGGAVWPWGKSQGLSGSRGRFWGDDALPGHRGSRREWGGRLVWGTGQGGGILPPAPPPRALFLPSKRAAIMLLRTCRVSSHLRSGCERPSVRACVRARMRAYVLGISECERKRGGTRRVCTGACACLAAGARL